MKLSKKANKNGTSEACLLFLLKLTSFYVLKICWGGVFFFLCACLSHAMWNETAHLVCGHQHNKEFSAISISP